MNTLRMLFGVGGPTPAEALRKHKNSLNRTVRDLEREEAKLAIQEKKLTMEIRKSAKEGHMNAAKIQARDLLRTRKNIEKFAGMRLQVRTLVVRLTAMGANIDMTKALKDAGQVLGQMNKTANLPGLQRIAMEFERENDLMEQRQEIMDDAMDEATGVDEDEAEDEILDKILEEIGVDLKHSMGETPQGLQGTAVAEGKVAQAIGGGDPGDDDLQARLNGLRR